MGARTCANHKDAPATAQCHQCKKDLCKSCVMVTPTGIYCSTQCSTIARELKARGGEKKKSGSAAKAFMVLLLLAIAYVVGAYLVAPGTQYDVLGMLIKR